MSGGVEDALEAKFVFPYGGKIGAVSGDGGGTGITRQTVRASPNSTRPDLTSKFVTFGIQNHDAVFVFRQPTSRKDPIRRNEQDGTRGGVIGEPAAFPVRSVPWWISRVVEGEFVMKLYGFSTYSANMIGACLNPVSVNLVNAVVPLAGSAAFI